MELAAWVIGFLVGLALLQVLAYHFLRDRFDTSPRTGLSGRSGTLLAPTSDPDTDPAETGCRCPACGTLNERQYTFCRTCVGRLAT